MRFIKQLLVVFVLVALTTTVRAEDTVVLPSAGPANLNALAKTIDSTLLDVAKELPGTATMGAVSLAELALVTGCAAGNKACLKKVLDTVRSKRVLTASIEETAERTTIHVDLIGAAGNTSRESVTVLATTKETAIAVGNAARALVGIKAVEVKTVEIAPPMESEPVVAKTTHGSTATAPPLVADEPSVTSIDPRSDSGSFSFGKTRPTSWAVLGGGAAALTVGIVFHGLAARKQGDVNDAPADTIGDVRALIELEDATRRRSQLGFAFTGIGVAALVVGGILMVRDGRRTESNEIVTMMPTRGGAIVGFGGRL